MKTKLAIIFAPLLVVSCSTLKYEEPTSGPRARVRFTTNSYSVAILRTYGDAHCETDEQEWMRLSARGIPNAIVKRLDIPLWTYRDGQAVEVYVAANRPLNGMFISEYLDNRKINRCGAPFFYTFKENTEYEVSHYGAPAQACSVTISTITNVGGKPNKEQAAYFSNIAYPEHSGCIKAFKKMRLF